MFSPLEFWDRAWGALPPGSAADAVRAFHNETMTLVSRMEEGVVKEKALQALQPPGPNTMSPTDQIDAYLGEPQEGVRRRTAPQPRTAAGFAVLARRGVYAADVEDEAYHQLSSERLKVFYRRCTHRVEIEFLEALEHATGVDLGRP